MRLPALIAKQFRDIYFGGNWTAVDLKQTLTGVTWQDATTKVYSFNTIAILVYHMNYYVETVTRVLNGEALDSKDEYSFNVPPVNSQEDWKNLVHKFFSDAENLASMIEKFPEGKLEEIFVNDKYGTYYRNFTGIVEHNHYHLGQIVLIKKILAADKNV
jgi:hypothetical protein